MLYKLKNITTDVINFHGRRITPGMEFVTQDITRYTRLIGFGFLKIIKEQQDHLIVIEKQQHPSFNSFQVDNKAIRQKLYGNNENNVHSLDTVTVDEPSQDINNDDINNAEINNDTISNDEDNIAINNIEDNINEEKLQIIVNDTVNQLLDMKLDVIQINLKDSLRKNLQQYNHQESHDEDNIKVKFDSYIKDKINEYMQNYLQKMEMFILLI